MMGLLAVSFSVLPTAQNQCVVVVPAKTDKCIVLIKSCTVCRHSLNSTGNLTQLKVLHFAFFVATQNEILRDLSATFNLGSQRNQGSKPSFGGVVTVQKRRSKTDDVVTIWGTS